MAVCYAVDKAAPHLDREFFPLDHAVGMFGEVLEHTELGSGQVHSTTADLDAATPMIDTQLAQVEHRGLVCHVRRSLANAAQQHLDTSRHFLARDGGKLAVVGA